MVLVDTIGELGALWGLADVAFVGGSLDGRRGGQNMIEPAAYGAAVVFGPHVWNFKEPAARLIERGAARSGAGRRGAGRGRTPAARRRGGARSGWGRRRGRSCNSSRGRRKRRCGLLDELLMERQGRTAAA